MAMSTEMSGACPLLSLSGVDLDASRRSRMTGSTADEAWEQQLLESEAAVAAARAPVSRRRRRRGIIMVLLGRKWKVPTGMVVAQTAKQVDPDFSDRCSRRPLPIDENMELVWR